MLDFRFRTWLESETRSIVGEPVVNANSKSSVEKFHKNAKDFIEYYKSLKLQNNSELSGQQLEELMEKIHLIDLIDDSVVNAFYRDKQVFVPEGLEMTAYYFKSISQIYEQLSLIIGPYLKNNENAKSIAYYIKEFKIDYQKLDHAMKVANNGHGNRFVGKFQDQANKISSDVKQVVINLLRQELTNLGKKDPKLQETIIRYWNYVKKSLQNPIAFSALQKESYDSDSFNGDDKRREEVHSRFIKDVQNLKNLLQTPRLWRDANYVSQVLLNVFDNYFHSYPELFKMDLKKGQYPYKLEQTVNAVLPVIRLLPNIVQHFSENDTIKYTLKKLNYVWQHLKEAWNSYKNSGPNKGIGPATHYYVDEIKNILPQIKKHIEDKLNTYFPSIGENKNRNKNNYLKAVNFYINRLLGILNTV